MLIQPVILCGGSGSRLWPLSREHYPKQLLKLCGEHTMLQSTALRLGGINLEGGDRHLPPILVGNEEYRFLLAEQLHALGLQAQLILEPSGRSTAPALTIAALSADPEAILVVMPSDHLIRDDTSFCQSVRQATLLAKLGKVVIFGVTPTSPETGYGYILSAAALPDSPAYEVQRFVEKPDAERAREYMASGAYYWNAGIFVVKAGVWLSHIERLHVGIAKACRRAHAESETDRDFIRPGASAYAACPADSIDVAVMEKLADGSGSRSDVVVLPLNAGWSDVGAWNALWDVSPKNEQGNVAQGDVLLRDTGGSLVLAESRFVACVGMEDVVVVETADAVLVANKSKVQDIGKLVKMLNERQRPESRAHRKVYRPWGWYDQIDAGSRFQVKRIVVKPGGRLSLQRHHHRAEHWVVVCGTAKVTRGDEHFLVSENESTYIPLGIAHRLENPGKVPLEMIEVQSGAYLGEDDIVRLEDSYGRA